MRVLRPDKDLPLLPLEIDELVSIWKIQFEHEATWDQLPYPESPLPFRHSASEFHRRRDLVVECQSSDKHRRECVIIGGGLTVMDRLPGA